MCLSRCVPSKFFRLLCSGNAFSRNATGLVLFISLLFLLRLDLSIINFYSTYIFRFATVAVTQCDQIVIDALGLVGQISNVFPETSEVTLLIDKKMSVPIQIQRNGLRAITNGDGQSEMILISYLPSSVDVIQGDIVRTSGIDTIYPEGLAVAEIIEINHDPKLPFAKIICKPIASIRNHTHLLVVMPLGNLNNPMPFKNDKK